MDNSGIPFCRNQNIADESNQYSQSQYKIVFMDTSISLTMDYRFYHWYTLHNPKRFSSSIRGEHMQDKIHFHILDVLKDNRHIFFQ